MGYDFKAARSHIQELTMMYRGLRYRGMLDKNSSTFLLGSIQEIEEEISAAKEKMAALAGYHFSKQNVNLLTHIIPSSDFTNKGESLNEHVAWN